MFQYGIVYKLQLTGKDTSLAVYSGSYLAYDAYFQSPILNLSKS